MAESLCRDRPTDSLGVMSIIWIKKNDLSSVTPLDRYYDRVYCPFVASTVLLSNTCEHLLACTFAALRLKYERRTLGQKIAAIRKRRQLFETLIGSDVLASTLEALDRANEYFQLAKHSHFAGYPEVGHNQSLLEDDFDFDQLDLKIVDVSTLQEITLTAQDRRCIQTHLAATSQKLIPLKEAAERYREKCDSGDSD
jgi:hypothetical protein